MNNDCLFYDMDLTIPDLLPIGDITNDLPLINDPERTSLQQEIINISARLEKLTIDNNTLALRVEIERTKRRKLQTSLKQVRNQLLHPCPDMAIIKQEMTMWQQCQDAVNYQFDGELTHQNSLNFRSLARMHEIFAYLLPHIMLPPVNGHEVNQMLDELTRTIRQFHTYYEASYV